MTAPMGTPMGAPGALPPAPKPPWTPFQTRPNDAEPAVATIWARKLSNIISSTEYAAADADWREPLDAKYKAAIQAITPPPVLENPSKPGPKPGGGP